MINTKIAFVKWDLHSPHNMQQGARQRMAVDTQQYVRQMDPHGSLENNPEALSALQQSADELGFYLLQRKAALGITDIPLTYEGALYVINKLRSSQPKSKIMKMMKVAKLIDWHVVSNMSSNPATSTSIFIKNEGYPALDKSPRLICFPAEGEKLLMSMAFYPIMHAMFSSPYCTKEIPDHLRPRVIERRLSALPNIYVGDYTSWECVPNREIMQAGEHRVLKYVTPREYWFLFDWIEHGGILRNKNGVRIKIPAVQYSGRYTTSLSNTIRNKLMMDTVSKLIGKKYHGVFEGDDSLTTWPLDVTKEDILTALHKIGVHADIDHYDKLGSAGYCSTWWNDDYELLYNPIKAIAKFPFSSSALASSIKNYEPLLAAKSMSLAYVAPGCPITWAIAKRYISSVGYMETRNQYEVNWFSHFTQRIKNHSRKTLKVRFDRWDLIRPPTQKQRQQFFEVFNISDAQQKECEKSILEDDGFTWKAIDCLRTIKTGEDIDALHASYVEQVHKALLFKRN